MDAPALCATCQRELPRDAVACPFDGTPAAAGQAVAPGAPAAAEVSPAAAPASHAETQENASASASSSETVSGPRPQPPPERVSEYGQAPAGPGAPEADPLIGVQLGEYVVQERIAGGGMGLVYRGVQPLIGKAVAIKVLRSDVIDNPVHVERLLAEARAVNAIRHRSIIDIFSFGRTPDGRHYVVMELLDGIALDAYLVEHGALAPHEALEIFNEVLAAMAAAHEAEVVHRDLKPSNIFLVRQPGGGRYVKVLDFGLAKRPDESGGSPKTIDGTIVGTPAYMAPEQIRGQEVSAKTDLYSFGVMAYETLTGHLPFAGTSVADFLTGHLSVAPFDPLALRPELPAPLAALLLRMLEKEPADRPTLADVRAELKRLGRALRSEVTVQAPLDGGRKPPAVSAEPPAPDAPSRTGPRPLRAAGEVTPPPRAPARSRAPALLEPEERSGVKPRARPPGPLEAEERSSVRRAKPPGSPEERPGMKPARPQAPVLEPEERSGVRPARAQAPVLAPEERSGVRAARAQAPVLEPEERSGVRAVRARPPVLGPEERSGVRASRPQVGASEPEARGAPKAVRPASEGSGPQRVLSAAVPAEEASLADTGAMSMDALAAALPKARPWGVIAVIGAAVLAALGAGVLHMPEMFGLGSARGPSAVRPVEVAPPPPEVADPRAGPPTGSPATSRRSPLKDPSVTPVLVAGTVSAVAPVKPSAPIASKDAGTVAAAAPATGAPAGQGSGAGAPAAAPAKGAPAVQASDTGATAAAPVKASPVAQAGHAGAPEASTPAKASAAAPAQEPLALNLTPSAAEATQAAPSSDASPKSAESAQRSPARSERKLDQRSLLRSISRFERELKSGSRLTESEQQEALEKLHGLRTAAGQVTGTDELRKISEGLENWKQFYLKR